jgi:RNA polymerase sigma-70 factor (sigma-E family)
MEEVVVARTDADFVAVLADDLPRIQRLARLLTGQVEAAEDVVAEAIARSLPRWRTGQVHDLGAYLRTVVVNLSSRGWRRRLLASRRDHHSLDWLTVQADVEAGTAERDRTLRAVMQLPVRRRAVVVLRFYDDLSEAQIAAVLGVRVGTVKSQLSRALEQLRSELGALEEV